MPSPDPNKVLAQKRAYREKNREKYNAYMREWYKTPAGRANTKRRVAVRREQRRANPELQRHNKFRQRYGIGLDDYNRMIDEQDGVCAVCGRNGHTKHPLHVDHCHASGRIRGLLCAPCNLALGALEEDPKRMVALARYIKSGVLSEGALS